MKESKKIVYDLSLIITAFIWGISFVWVKDVLNAGMSSSFFLFLRYTLASLILLMFCIKDLKKITREQLYMGVVIGFFLYAAMLVQTIALNVTTPSNSAFITTSYVVITPFVTWFMLRVRPKKKIYFCAVMCLAGLFVLTRVPGQAFSVSAGDALTLFSAVLFAFQITFLFRFSSHMTTKLITFLPLATTAVLSFTTALVTNSITLKGVDTLACIFPIIATALCATIGAGYLQSFGQRHVEPSRAAIIFSLESVFACAASVAMGLDKLTPNLVIGGAIIVATIIVSEWKPKQS